MSFHIINIYDSAISGIVTFCDQRMCEMKFSSPDDNFRLGQLGYIHYNYIFIISYYYINSFMALL